MYWAVRVGGGSGYGLESDYDFRDLERLKPRDPLPDRKSFAVTWREAEIPKPVKRKKGLAPERSPASVQPPLSEADAKAKAQDAMVATKAR